MEAVRIYQPIHNPMQSGKAKKRWVIEYVRDDTRFVEPLMGWTANTDTKPQLRLFFASKEQALSYAEARKLSYEVILPHKPELKLQAYADNFQ